MKDAVGTNRGSSTRDLFVLFLLGAVYRILLLLSFPVPFGNDGFGRLYFRDQLFLSHWLPMTQAIVILISGLEEGIFWTRVVFALIGAASATGFYLYLRTLVRREAALLGSLLFSFNALYVLLSLMPYQDVLFLGLFYAALGFLFRSPKPQTTVACILFGLACLTRYEAWFTIPFLFVWQVSEGFRKWSLSLSKVLESGLYFGWGPLCWFVLSAAYWGGWTSFLFQTPDRSFYGWHPHFDLFWALRYGFRMAYWVLLFGSPLILVALPAVVSLLRHRRPLANSLKVLFSGGLLVLGFFFFIIGKDQETVFRFVGFPLSICLVVAAIGIDVLLEWLRERGGLSWGRPAWIGILLLGGLMIYSAIPVYRINRDPQYRDPFRIARYLESVLQPGERVIVVADRFRDLSDDAPILYQRITTQMGDFRDRILSAGVLGEVEEERLRRFAREQKVRYLVIFTNFDPWLPSDIYFASVAQGESEVLETETARVFRVEDW